MSSGESRARERKPLIDAQYREAIDRFAEKMKRLGFQVEPIGKPISLDLQAQTLSTTSLIGIPTVDVPEQLPEHSRASVDETLTDKGADGAFIVNVEQRYTGKSHPSYYYIQEVSVILTLLPYRLVPPDLPG